MNYYYFLHGKSSTVSAAPFAAKLATIPSAQQQPASAAATASSHSHAAEFTAAAIAAAARISRRALLAQSICRWSAARHRRRRNSHSFSPLRQSNRGLATQGRVKVVLSAQRLRFSHFSGGKERAGSDRDLCYGRWQIVHGRVESKYEGQACADTALVFGRLRLCHGRLAAVGSA